MTTLCLYHSFSHHYQGSFDFNSANTTCPARMYFLVHTLVWIKVERMSVHCLESGYFGKHIPFDHKISLGPRDVPRTSPLGYLSVLGNLLVVGDVQPNTSLLSAVYGCNPPWFPGRRALLNNSISNCISPNISVMLILYRTHFDRMWGDTHLRHVRSQQSHRVTLISFPKDHHYV